MLADKVFTESTEDVQPVLLTANITPTPNNVIAKMDTPKIILETASILIINTSQRLSLQNLIITDTTMKNQKNHQLLTTLSAHSSAPMKLGRTNVSVGTCTSKLETNV